MIEGTARKTSLENKHLRNFPIIQSCSHSTMLAKYVTDESVSAPLN